MARKISPEAGYVHVTDPETGEVTVLAPGDTVPSKFEKLVGEHATTGVSRRSTVPAGSGQTPESEAAGKAAQDEADEAADASAKADADAEALAAAEKAEAEKAAAASKTGGK